MEIKSRRKLGIFLSALVFVGNYLPWVRQAASLPDTLTLSSGQIHLIQTGLPMYASVQGEAVSVMASQDERIGVALNARQGGETSVTFSLLGLIPVHETRVNVVEERMLIPGGQAVGVALKTRGVLVVSGSSRQRGSGLKTGDVILSAEGQAVLSTKELAERVGNAEGETVQMEILRAGQKLIVDVSAPVDESDGKRRLGVWVRDSTAGAILRASVVGVTRGQNGRAGELKGSFLKEGTQIGSLLENGEYGIYGVMAEGRGDALYPQGLPVGTRDTVHVGAASILATVDSEGPKEYGIEIVRCFSQTEPSQKGMILRVTDESGIVQGMSGSPILQDGRIIGAVTHVYLNDAAQGYGMYIEWMLCRSDALEQTAEDAAA